MDERKPIVIVAGMGRCGTSLVMAMLEAGGVAPAFGAAPPGYESVAVRDAIARGDYEWCAAAAGRAVKVLEPHRYRVPPAALWPARVIWLERDLEAQARSWLEYRLRLGERWRQACEWNIIKPQPAMALLERPKNEAFWLRREAARLREGNRRARAALVASGQPWITVPLEKIHLNAFLAAAALDEFIHGAARPYVVEAMAARVEPDPAVRGHVPA